MATQAKRTRKAAAKSTQAKPEAKPAAKPAVAKKAAKKAAKTIPGQRELFDLFEMEQPAPQVEIFLRVPSGTPVTIGGNPTTACAPAASTAKSNPLKTLATMDKEALREEVRKSGLSASELINLTTTLHGVLYKLAAIGAKVTKGGN